MTKGRKPLTTEQVEERKAKYKQIALDFYNKYNRTPKMKDIRQSGSIIKLFGTWNNFIRECGLKVNHFWYF